MRRVCKKPKAKHVRRAMLALRKLGAVEILVEINGHYFLSWVFQGVAMRIALARSAGRNASERAWSEIRTQFRHKKFEVPACAC